MFPEEEEEEEEMFQEKAMEGRKIEGGKWGEEEILFVAFLGFGVCFVQLLFLVIVWNVHRYNSHSNDRLIIKRW